MKQKIENKLKELEERYQRRLGNANSIELEPHARGFWYMKADETLEQIELLKELIKE